MPTRGQDLGGLIREAWLREASTREVWTREVSTRGQKTLPVARAGVYAGFCMAARPGPVVAAGTAARAAARTAILTATFATWRSRRRRAVERPASMRGSIRPGGRPGAQGRLAAGVTAIEENGRQDGPKATRRTTWGHARASSRICSQPSFRTGWTGRSLCAGRKGESPRPSGFGGRGADPSPLAGPRPGRRSFALLRPPPCARWFARGRWITSGRPHTRAGSSGSPLRSARRFSRRARSAPRGRGRWLPCAAARRGPLALVAGSGLAGLEGRPGRNAGADAGRTGLAAWSFLSLGSPGNGRCGLSTLAATPQEA